MTHAERQEKVKNLHYLINYLSVLQEGRAKPDRNGGTIRESLESIDDILAVKEEINSILELIEIERIDKH